MSIYKNRDFKVDISFGTSTENKGAPLYTEDKGSASIKVIITHKGKPFNFNESDMLPSLNLSHSDGSFWNNEQMTIIVAESGIVSYNIPENIIEHVGMLSGKLFLKNDTASIHVLNFSIDILDSGVLEIVMKEINIPMVEDVITNIMQENALGLLDETFKTEVLDSFEAYTIAHPELFKGEKGDKGEKGERGETGLQGVKGDTGATGLNGAQGEQGPRGYQGVQGPKGDKGDTGSDAYIVVSPTEPSVGNIWFEVLP